MCLRNEKIAYKIAQHSLQKVHSQPLSDQGGMVGTVAVRARGQQCFGVMSPDDFSQKTSPDIISKA